MLKIAGYPDRYSVAPGETIRFMVSLEEGEAFEARLVRVIHGDCNPAGPGLKFATIDHPANGRYPGRRQTIDAGSYMAARGVPAPVGGSFGFTAYLWPTLPDRPMQVVAAQWNAATKAGFKIALDEGALSLVTGDGSGRTGRHGLACRMRNRAWYAIRVRVDGKARASRSSSGLSSRRPLPTRLAGFPAPWRSRRERPGVSTSPAVRKRMAVSASTSTARSTARSSSAEAGKSSRAGIFPGMRRPPSAVDIGPHKRHGKLVNLPARA